MSGRPKEGLVNDRLTPVAISLHEARGGGEEIGFELRPGKARFERPVFALEMAARAVENVSTATSSSSGKRDRVRADGWCHKVAI